MQFVIIHFNISEQGKQLHCLQQNSLKLWQNQGMSFFKMLNWNDPFIY